MIKPNICRPGPTGLWAGYPLVRSYLTQFEKLICIRRPETNFIRNSIRFRGAIAWNTLTNKETRAKTLKEFKRCLVKFDTDKMHFEPILATTKNRDIGYE